MLRSEEDIKTANDDGVMISPSQAVRAYKAGTRRQYACEIYNASGPVQLTLSVWRGAERVLTAPADTLIPPAGQAQRFAAGGAFKLGEGLPSGDYILQVVASTTSAGKEKPTARAVKGWTFG